MKYCQEKSLLLFLFFCSSSYNCYYYYYIIITIIIIFYFLFLLLKLLLLLLLLLTVTHTNTCYSYYANNQGIPMFPENFRQYTYWLIHSGIYVYCLKCSGNTHNYSLTIFTLFFRHNIFPADYCFVLTLSWMFTVLSQ